MKTLSRKKLLVGLIALFTALCALFGVLSMPRSVSADSTAFDWSKYDNPENYTETVIYDKEEDEDKKEIEALKQAEREAQILRQQQALALKQSLKEQS